MLNAKRFWLFGAAVLMLLNTAFLSTYVEIIGAEPSYRSYVESCNESYKSSPKYVDMTLQEYFRVKRGVDYRSITGKDVDEATAMDACRHMWWWGFGSILVDAEKRTPAFFRLAPWEPYKTAWAVILMNWVVMIISTLTLVWAASGIKARSEGFFRIVVIVSSLMALLALVAPDATLVISPVTKMFTFPALTVVPLYVLALLFAWVRDGFKVR